MSLRSESFFHLTRSRRILESILSDGGFWPRYCSEPHIWQTTTARQMTDFWLPLVSFCDIPLTKLKDHAATYGYFGLGMTKEWGLRSQLHPVAYVDPQGPVNKLLSETQFGANYQTWQDASGFIKPISGVQKRDGAMVPTEFYAEYEWRYLARHDAIKLRLELPGYVCNNPDYPLQAFLDENNELTHVHCLLRFEPADVRYVFVNSDGDIPSVVNKINRSAFSRTHPEDTSTLLTRIISFETLLADF